MGNDASRPAAEVQFELLCEDDRHRLEVPSKIRVSPRGKLVSVERLDGHVIEDGSERYGLNWKEFDRLLGRLLTLCDATFADPIQRKAFKDRVRNDVKEWVAGISMDAAWDAGIQSHVGAPFIGGVLTEYDNPLPTE